MQTFRTLELAIEFQTLTELSNIQGNLRNQLLRASSSIALNLAEGNAMFTVREKRRFFQTAFGSLRECQVIFRLAKCNDEKLLQTADHLAASLYKLVKSEIKEFK